jgi:hypothetical protein
MLCPDVSIIIIGFLLAQFGSNQSACAVLTKASENSMKNATRTALPRISFTFSFSPFYKLKAMSDKKNRKKAMQNSAGV